jgi:FAD/FMN-containing dehydrogenase
MKSGTAIQHLRAFPAILVLLCSPVSCRSAFHLLRTASQDVNELRPVPQGYADDASRLNLTKVGEVWKIPEHGGSPEKKLAALLGKARQEGLRVSIAGARHTMGGHTIYPGGIVINTLSWNHMKLDERREILTVGAGAVWADVIRYLDARGRSVEVMQSNNSFSVGGSISANCHGWQFGRPPIASTVDSFRLMKADGSLVRCSREENPELFSLALGGYGLFGIILDVDLRVTENKRYKIERRWFPVAEGLAQFGASAGDADGAQMIYGRMNVTRKRFLNEMVVNRLFTDESGPIPALAEPDSYRFKRTIFRGSAYGDYGKRLRWNAESKLQPKVSGEFFSRNQLLNESVEVFQNRSDDSTDILHEYFLPSSGALSFVESMREIVSRYEGNLLNVTVRSVNRDTDTFLRYADDRMVSFVMLFVQERTNEAEAGMEAMTRELIDASLLHGGRYYLPYRLHATRKQFDAAYPMGEAFFRKKRLYDPDGLFQNQFYLQYGQTTK